MSAASSSSGSRVLRPAQLLSELGKEEAGVTPLHIAARQEHAAIAKLCLEKSTAAASAMSAPTRNTTTTTEQWLRCGVDAGSRSAAPAFAPEEADLSQKLEDCVSLYETCLLCLHGGENPVEAERITIRDSMLPLKVGPKHQPDLFGVFREQMLKRQEKVGKLASLKILETLEVTRTETIFTIDRAARPDGFFVTAAGTMSLFLDDLPLLPQETQAFHPGMTLAVKQRQGEELENMLTFRLLTFLGNCKRDFHLRKRAPVVGAGPTLQQRELHALLQRDSVNFKLKITTNDLKELEKQITDVVAGRQGQTPLQTPFLLEYHSPKDSEWFALTHIQQLRELDGRIRIRIGAASSPPQPSAAAASSNAVRCVICLDYKPAGISCPEESHFTCALCLGNYVIQSCKGNGIFETPVQGGPGKSVESPPGALPCPMFKAGCTCGSFPRPQLLATLGLPEAKEIGLQAMGVFLSAVERAAVVQQDRERARHEEAERARQARLGDLAQLSRAVELSLQAGQSVPCPICNEAWRKDDACMHMDCSKCGHRFCYVCGRSSTRGDCLRGGGCDAESPFLERNEDWSHFSGHEALIEFQVRLMTFFVDVARKVIGTTHWERLISSTPQLLDKVLEGRSIQMALLDGNCLPPLFGHNKEDASARRAEVARRTVAALSFLLPVILPVRERESENPLECKLTIFQDMTKLPLDPAKFFMESAGQDLVKAVETFLLTPQEVDVPVGLAAAASSGEAPITELAEPMTFLVAGAGGYGRAVNGEYRPAGTHLGRPLFRQIGGSSVMYYSGGMWKINDEDSLAGWYYSIQSADQVPPQGHWTTEGYAGRSVQPPPVVSRRLGPPMEPRPVPATGVIMVEGAGGVGSPVNGAYTLCGTFRGRSKFRQLGGQSIIYWNLMWRINFRDDMAGWFYASPADDAGRALPPAGQWTTEGYSAGNADPPPHVRLVGFEEQQPHEPVTIRVLQPRGNPHALTGEYRSAGDHNGRPKYQLAGGEASIFFHEHRWRLTESSLTTSPVFLAGPVETMFPPEGTWALEGAASADALPVIVEHAGHRQRAETIASWRDCRIGEQVRVLPVELAEGPTQASAANWTRSCADHAGQVGTIAQIDRDNTIQLRFRDNELLWYAVQSCTKTLEDTAEMGQLIQVWVVGAGGRGASLNGTFRQDGQHRGKPMYRKVGGGAVIYWSNFWKMSPSSLTGWFYSVVGDFPLPPSGPWTTHGYGGRDVLPAPEVVICEPLVMEVEEAGHGSLIGSYQQTGILNSRPKYAKQGGQAFICFNGARWQLHPGEGQDPCYYVESQATSPPAGRWAAIEDGGETALVGRRVMLSEPPEEVGEPIQRVAECHLGERVRILPLALAEGPTRESSASWTDACAARCGQEGTINLIDRDETLQVKFADGRCLWFAARSCTKLGNGGNAVPPARVKVIVRGAGGRGARLDGTYRQDGDHNGRPLYRQVDGNGIVYCGPDSAWRISPGSLGGWFYSLSSTSPLPPEGPWTTEGFSGKGVTPAPVVSLESDEAEAAAPVRRHRVLRGRGQARGASSSSESEEEEEPAAGPAPGPASIVVTGAGGVGAHLNGTYRPCGVFKMRPKYRQEGGNAIIYFRERWKMNYQDDVDGWYYSAASTERFPPAGSWTTEGYDDGDADPAPMVQHP